MYNIINICLVCVCNSIIIMTENEVELSYGRVIYERIDLLDLLDDDLSDIYFITGHRQSLRKCACTCVRVCCMYSVHSLLLWLYTVQWRWVGCCCRCACQWRDRSCCTVPVCTTTLFQILCQNVQCAVCAVPSPLAHKWRPVDHHGSDQWSCTGVFQITDEVMTTIGDISETPTVTR